MRTPADISSDALRLGDAGRGWAAFAGTVGVLGLAASLVLALFDDEAFLRAYVVNYAFLASLALGALFFVILQHLTRAGWSVVVRRLAENVTAVFPLLAILALPIIIPLLLGFDVVHHVYPWTDAEHVAHDSILRGKQAYLNVPFFVIRLVCYLALWVVLANFFYQNSVRQDQTGDPGLTTHMQSRSNAAIILYALSTTFFSFDLLMSLDPHWFSTIFGVYYFSGAAVGFFALLALMMVILQKSGFLGRTITVDHYHDVGKLVFAFIVFWAYIAFSQYMLIWYGNMPEETAWYVLRQQQPWLTFSLLLLFGHFIVPFLALMSRYPKRHNWLLSLGAIWVLAMHWCDCYWLAMPHHAHDGQLAAGIHVLDALQAAASLVGMLGLATWLVIGRMRGAALVPERDPRLPESLEFENI